MKTEGGMFGRHKRPGLNPWVGKIHWQRKWHPTLVFLLGESHGQRSLVGHSPWGHKESDATAHLSHSKQSQRGLELLGENSVQARGQGWQGRKEI